MKPNNKEALEQKDKKWKPRQSNKPKKPHTKGTPDDTDSEAQYENKDES